MRRGGMLFEVMVALAILLMASMTLGAIVMQSVGAMDRTRRSMQACDLARSTMAQIEAGILDAASVSGPVRRWDASMFLMPEDAFAPAGGAEPVEASAELPGEIPVGVSENIGPEWSVEVETEPTEFDGLWLVTVTAQLQAAQAPDVVLASYTLRQVVRLGTEPEDVAGEEDELMDAARRGLQRGGRP